MTTKTIDSSAQESFKTKDADSYNAVVDYFDRYTERFTRHMPEPMLALANVEKNARVLDIGTGTGVVALNVVNDIPGKGFVVGIDLSDGMLATATAKAKSLGLSDNTDFRKMDAENLELEDNSFDACLSLYALRHFPNPDKSIAEIYRVLKPGARIVAAVGSPPELFSSEGIKSALRHVASICRKALGRELNACEFIDALVEKHIPKSVDRETAEWVDDHHHGFTGSIEQLVKDAGYEDIHTSWKGQYSIIESAEDFWLLQMTFSSVARKRIANASNEQIKNLRTEFDETCNQVLAKGGRLVYQTGAAIVSARKPYK